MASQAKPQAPQSQPSQSRDIRPPPDAPKSLLGRHRILCPTASVRVSPLCLGAMNFGDAWKEMMGECSKPTAFEMLDYFYEMGGNFLDTANAYQNEESEIWIGEWLESRGKRDEMVVATKYTSPYKGMADGKMRSNFGGNSAKSMWVSIEASLKKLRTDYIDLFYVHFWDMTTSIPELMQSLNHLVSSHKVLYLGISDTPAWIVAKCNAYARHHNLRPFSVYQGKWSAAERDFERDIIPMCLDEGMAMAPWGALGGGYFKPKGHVDQGEGRKFRTTGPKNNPEQVSEVLSGIAERKGSLVTSVALAYVMHKAPYVYPICGGRKVEHLKGNIEALSLRLSDEDIEEIEGAYDFDVGFPHNMISGTKEAPKGPEDNVLNKRFGNLDFVKGPQPILPGGN